VQSYYVMMNTVKLFNLAALTVGNFTSEIIFGEFKPHSSNFNTDAN